MKLVELFGPGVKALGMAPALAPSYMPPGVFERLRNVNVENGLLRVRWGNTVISGGSSAFQQNGLRGVFTGLFYGNQSVYAAWRIAGANKTGVFFLNPQTGSWIEVTAPGGKYGGGRMDSNAPVSFAVVRASDAFNGSREYLVASNGFDPPVVINDEQAAYVHPITPPQRATVAARATWTTFLNVKSTPSSVSSDPTRFVGLGGTALGLRAIAGTNPNGQTVTYTYPSSALKIGENASSQIHFVARTSSVNNSPRTFWENMDVEIATNAGSWVKIHSAADLDVPEEIEPVRPATGNGQPYDLVAFDVTDVPFGDYNRLRFTWRGGPVPGSSPADDYMYVIAAMGVGGSLFGGTDFQVAHVNDGSRTESAAVTAQAPLRGVRLDKVGGPRSLRAYYLPNAPGLALAYEVTTTVPTATDLARGVAFSDVYVRPPDSDSWSVAGRIQVASWNGMTWQGVRNPGFPVVATVAGPGDVAVSPPDFLMEPLPRAKELWAFSTRLAAAQVKTDTGHAPRVFISEAGHPFRFRAIQRYDNGAPDPDSGTSVEFGGQEVRALRSIAGDYYGVETLGIWTDKNVYVIDGSSAASLSRARLASPYGVLAPQAVTTIPGGAVWLDSSRQVRTLDGRVLSYGVVDSDLAQAGEGDASMVVFGERVYLSFGVIGDSGNPVTLVYDMRTSSWVDHVTTTRYTYLRTFDTGSSWPGLGINQQLLLGFSSSNLVTYRHETPGATQDAGAPISMVVRARELSAAPRNVVAGRVAIRMDSAEAIIGVSRVIRVPVGGTGAPIQIDGTIDLGAASGGEVMRYDQDENGRPPGGEGLGAQVVVSGFVPGGSRMRALYLETRGSDDAIRA